MDLSTIVKFEEGFRSHPYLCSAGYVTIGYGTKLHNHKGLDPKHFCLALSKKTAELLLTNTLVQFDNLLENGSLKDIYLEQPAEVKAILISMAYQMGYQGLTKFHNMWNSLDVKDYEMAADEMLDSKWAREDSPARALRHSIVVRTLSMDVYEGMLK